MTPTVASVEVGSNRSFLAEVKDQYGNAVTDADLQWRVVDASIASIVSAGEVRGVAPGSTQVEALVAGTTLRTTASLTVDPAAPEVEAPKLPEAPHAIVDLRVKSVTHNSVVLSFTEVSDGTGAPASYSIRYGSPDFSMSWGSRASTEISIDGSKVGGTIDLPYVGLSAATDYAFRVVAVRNSLDGEPVQGEVSSSVVARTGSAPVEGGNDHSLTISPGSLELTGIGATAQLSAKLTNGSGQEVQGATLSWSSSNTRVATVSTGGRVTARGAGVALLTVAAACCGATDTISVIVYEAPSSTSGWEGTWQTESNGQVSTLVVDKSTVSVPQISLVTQATIQGETLKAGPASTAAGVVVLDLRLDSEASFGAMSADGASGPDRFSGTVSVNGETTSVVGVRQVDSPPSPEPEPTDPGVPSEPRTPPPPSGNGTPVFYDGFESGNNSKSQNGYRWNETSGSPDHRVADGAPVAYGDYAHRFRQGNTSENRLIRIQGPGLTELWFEYWIRIPDNYSHTGTGSVNNKWVELFNDKRHEGDTGNMLVALQTRPNAANDGGSRLRYTASGGKGTGGLTSEVTVTDDWITLADRGQWVRYGYRLRLSSAPNVNDGVFEAWKNGRMVGSLTNLPIYSIDAGNYLHEIINFQIMGWNNGTFSETMTWYVDEVKLYNQNPGW
jgi:hypothetical protein